MASTASDLIKFEKMATGEKSGTWGTLANVAMSRIEEAVAGYRQVTLAGVTYVLDDTQYLENSTTTSESHLKIIDTTGTPGASREITAPQRTWEKIFWNQVTTYDMTVAMASGNGVTITNGYMAHLISDGTNVEFSSPLTTAAGVVAPAALPAASATAVGGVELATDAETNSGTDTGRAITPANLTAWTGGGIANVVDDSTPQLGGFLDANSRFVSLSQGANIASVAGDTNIWTNFDGNTIHITGTNAITDFGTPKSAGDSMWVVFDAAASVVDSATVTVAGNTNYQAAANDLALVYALTTSTFLFMPFPNSGAAVVTADNSVTSAKIVDGTIVAADLADNAITLAKMAHGTDGNLITYDAAGAPAAVATGDSGQLLTSGGAGVAPTFAAAAGGGKVLQVVHVTDGTYASGTTVSIIDDTIPQNTEGDEFMTLAITPTAADSTLIIQAVGSFTSDTAHERSLMALFRDTTANALVGQVFEAGDAGFAGAMCMLNFSTAASSTSATTFKIRAGRESGGTTEFNSIAAGYDLAANAGGSMTIWEISA